MTDRDDIRHAPQQVKSILQHALIQAEEEQHRQGRVVSSSPNTSAAAFDAGAPSAAVALRTTSAATSNSDMPTVAVPLGAVSAGTALPAVSERIARRRRLQWKNPLKQLVRKSIIGVFGVWLKLSTNLVQHLNWFPSVKPYVGYGTEEYSRLVCRTIYAPTRAKPHTPMRGIHAMLEVPAAHERVSIHIDGVPLRTVQVGTMEVYDRNDPARAQTMAYSVSDSAGYLDLLAEHRLQPGVHRFSCKVPRRGPVEVELFTIPSDAKVGVISDVDDTIMVTQVPTLWKAAYNMLLLSPRKRASVPGMAVMYNDIRRMFGCAVLLPVHLAMERGELDPHLHPRLRVPRRAAPAARPGPAPQDLRALRRAAQARIRRAAHGGLPRHEVHPAGRRRAEGPEHVC